MKLTSNQPTSQVASLKKIALDIFDLRLLKVHPPLLTCKDATRDAEERPVLSHRLARFCDVAKCGYVPCWICVRPCPSPSSAARSPSSIGLRAARSRKASRPVGATVYGVGSVHPPRTRYCYQYQKPASRIVSRPVPGRRSPHPPLSVLSPICPTQHSARASGVPLPRDPPVSPRAVVNSAESVSSRLQERIEGSKGRVHHSCQTRAGATSPVARLLRLTTKRGTRDVNKGFKARSGVRRRCLRCLPYPLLRSRIMETSPLLLLRVADGHQRLPLRRRGGKLRKKHPAGRQFCRKARRRLKPSLRRLWVNPWVNLCNP